MKMFENDMAGAYMAGRGTRATEEMGKILFENSQDEKIVKLRETLVKEGICKEDFTFKEDMAMGSNTTVYTTAVAAMIDQVLRPDLIAAGAIKKIDLKSAKGFNSVKIPLNTLITAGDDTENVDITGATANMAGVTVTQSWKTARQQISQELLQASMVDLLKDQIQLIGYALQRKMDSDIVAALLTASPSNNANTNYTTTGGASTALGYDKLADTIGAMENNYAKPDMILMNGTDWAGFVKDTDVKAAMHFGTTPEGQILPNTVEVFGVKLKKNPQITAGSHLLIDSKQLGYLVEFTDTISYDGRIPKQIAFEVIGAKAYGVGINQPHALYRIEKA